MSSKLNKYGVEQVEALARGCFIKGSNNCGFLSLAPFATVPSPSISKSPSKGLSQNYDLALRKTLSAQSAVIVVIMQHPSVFSYPENIEC